MFHLMFFKLYDKCFPAKQVKANVVRKKKCWMTAGLIKSVKYKHRLYTKMLNHPSASNKSKFILYRNQFNILIKKCKIDYYTDKLNDAKNNVKKTWSIIKTILNKNTSTNTMFKKINHNGMLITNPDKIATAFNNYVTSIGPSLSSLIPQPNVAFDHYLKGSYTDSMYLYPTYQKEICDIVNSLKNGKSSGYDDISPDVLKSVIGHVISFLTSSK